MVLKKRLDFLLVEKQLAPSRQRAQALIMAGKVLVDEKIVDKPGIGVDADARIAVKGSDLPYVSRGGLKLEAALEVFKVDVNGLVCLDVGASTGGFTDCLLKHGASRVYAVDVGYGQLAWSLRQDSRVKSIERTNIRHLPPGLVEQPVDLATVDVSFISLKIVIPAILKLIKPQGLIVPLIKPQFEVGKGRVGKGGVVRDPLLHQEVVDDLRLFFGQCGLSCGGVIPSPVLGPKGNREFISVLRVAGERAAI